MEDLVDNIEINTQSSVKITSDKIIYIDPFKINNEMHDADIIFITHSHYDHYSIDDINKIKNDSTIIVGPSSVKPDIVVEPNNSYMVDNIGFSTVPAYNINKPFHKKSDNFVGYLINIDGRVLYLAGDTDYLNEFNSIKCDIAFVPIGGTYTMDYIEASKLVNTIKPSIVIPYHYGSIVGDISLGDKFSKLVNTKCIIKYTEM